MKNKILYVALFFMVGSCKQESENLCCDSTLYSFYFKAGDTSIFFKSIQYPSIYLEGEDEDVEYNNQRYPVKWIVSIDPPSNQVIFETSLGWDTLVYKANYTKPHYQESIKIRGTDKVIENAVSVNLIAPTIISHTFDSVYLEEVGRDINLVILKK